jgi:hypothetical protein
MAAVVLRGPANSAPEVIIGPFYSLRDAEDWAREHPRAGGYSVAQELTAASEFPAGEETLRLRLDSAGLLAGPDAPRPRPGRKETDAARRLVVPDEAAAARLQRLRALAQLGEMADRGDFDEFLGNKAAYRR